MPISKPCGIVPVGGVVAWLKSYTNTPALPSEYVECNGQALTGGGADAQSVYNGQTIPDLNGVTNVANHRFLRGQAASGGTGGSHCHTHIISSLICGCWLTCQLLSADMVLDTVNHLPEYYEVVWVMRIK